MKSEKRKERKEENIQKKICCETKENGVPHLNKPIEDNKGKQKNVE